MIMNKFFLTAVVLSLSSLCVPDAGACTNLIAGKKATTDGSVLLTYAADSYTRFGELCHFPAALHAPGDMRHIVRWGSYKHLGEIPEAERTFNVIGNMNEHQLALGESTWGGHKELEDTTGNSILDYGSLMYIALQRCRTAREAIKLMTDLADTYGYASTGESISVVDKNEAWILEIIGKGSGEKGAVWVAVRIPDNAIAAHANEPRIRKVDFSDADNVMHSKDVISFARKKGYFSGKDKDFSFADAYSTHDPAKRRSCDARVWSFFRRFDSEMEKYLDWCLGKSDEPMPLYIIPDRKLSVDDMKASMRDHYEGTPLDMTKDVGAGHDNAPYRWRPMRFEVDGATYCFERPISTQQTGWSFIAQCRDWLPDPIGGIFRFGTDDTNTTVYMPFYCSMTAVPEELKLKPGVADMNHFSLESNFWMNNWVANQLYNRYELMLPDVRKVQQALENEFESSIAASDARMLEQAARGNREGIEELANVRGAEMAGKATDVYRDLAQFLLVRYIDGAQKNLDADGQFMTTPEGYAAPPASPGYPKGHYKRIVEDVGDKIRLSPKK